MKAMMLRRQREPLRLEEVPDPKPKAGERLIDIEACAVCRTDLHIVDAELSEPKLPLIIGHQIVGRDAATGERVGVPWLGWTDGTCRYCTSGRENLCEQAKFTGYTIDGGYAERCAADARYCFRIPESYSAEEAAPMLCAGLIGFRAYSMVCGPALAGHGRLKPVRTLGLYGFGSSAQILAQIARAEGREVFAFTRDGDTAAQDFARTMGAVWAAGSSQAPPEPLDAAIIFAAAGPLVVTALRNVVKGGTVVCAGIHMSDIPAFSYDLLWGERAIRSVANLTRQDGAQFFERARGMRIMTQRKIYPLEAANEALYALRNGELVGTAVLRI
jgi:alcohol dehydrogenase, propanol-preferring